MQSTLTSTGALQTSCANDFPFDSRSSVSQGVRVLGVAVRVPWFRKWRTRPLPRLLGGKFERVGNGSIVRVDHAPRGRDAQEEQAEELQAQMQQLEPDRVRVPAVHGNGAEPLRIQQQQQQPEERAAEEDAVHETGDCGHETFAHGSHKVNASSASC